MLIQITEAAIKVKLPIHRTIKDGTLSVVGVLTTEEVAIEIPTVVDPDENNDNHWTPVMSNGEAIVLNSDNNILGIPFVSTLRVNKPASTGNAFGVDYQ